MSVLLALDPSIVSPGLAIFRHKVLVANAVLRVPATDDNHATRCLRSANAIVDWLAHQDVSIDCVAFEWPQIYDTDTPAKANAVVYMAGVDLALAALLRCPAESFLPAEVWGNLPKRKTGSAFASPRGTRIASRLTPAERAIAVDQHDAVDAIGIGLHVCGRLGVRRAPYSSSL